MPAASYATDPRAIAVAEAARRLVELRDRWLNPPEWVVTVATAVAGQPSGVMAKNQIVAEITRCDEEADQQP